MGRMSLDWTQGDLRVRATKAPRRSAMISDPRTRSGRQRLCSGAEPRLASAMSRRHTFQLVLVVQHGGYSMRAMRAGALTAVRPAFTIVVHQRLGEQPSFFSPG